MVLTILVFIIMLSVLVLIHELGHFLVAKKFGIKVEEFGFGFPPRVFGKRIGETLYSFNALPIGGFVKLYGEDEAGGGRVKRGSPEASSKKQVADIHRAFFSRPIWQRMLVVVAGVTMNFLLAVAIITYLFTTEGIPVQEARVSITEITKNSPAESSGLQKGDVVEKINNIEIKNTKTLIAETRKHLGEKITIQVRRGDQTQTLSVVPRKDFPSGEGPMGVAISQKVNFQKYPFPQSLYYGTKQALNDSWQVVVGFKTVVVELADRKSVV